MPTYNLYWAPEGRKIATVQALDDARARRMAPMPYRKFLGEIYAERVATHLEHATAASVATPCRADHLTFGGKCLNCGFDSATSENRS